MKKVFGLFLCAAFFVSANAQLVNLTYEQKEKFATIINMNGRLCAQVLEVRRHDQKTYYVLCELYRDKLQQGAYYVDLSSGKVK